MVEYLSRLTAYRLYVMYEEKGLRVPLSRNYLSCIRDDFWSPSLLTLEMLLYPLRIDVKDFFLAYERDRLAGRIGESPEFRGIAHDRKKVFRAVQELMAEKEKRRDCRAELRKRMGYTKEHVSDDFTRKECSVHIHKLIDYCNAAGVLPSEVFQRYYDSCRRT